MSSDQNTRFPNDARKTSQPLMFPRRPTQTATPGSRFDDSSASGTSPRSSALHRYRPLGRSTTRPDNKTTKPGPQPSELALFGSKGDRGVDGRGPPAGKPAGERGERE